MKGYPEVRVSVTADGIKVSGDQDALSCILEDRDAISAEISAIVEKRISRRFHKPNE